MHWTEWFWCWIKHLVYSFWRAVPPRPPASEIHLYVQTTSHGILDLPLCAPPVNFIFLLPWYSSVVLMYWYVETSNCTIPAISCAILCRVVKIICGISKSLCCWCDAVLYIIKAETCLSDTCLKYNNKFSVCIYFIIVVLYMCITLTGPYCRHLMTDKSVSQPMGININKVKMASSGLTTCNCIAV